ncbi:MAG: GIY-YIG nuclease family protein [Syntrophales bacterium]
MYIILCADDSFYTGITTNAEKRFLQHKDGRGAKYFRGHQPLKLIYLESGYDRSAATKKELEIKRLKHSEKCLLILSDMNELKRTELSTLSFTAPS